MNDDKASESEIEAAAERLVSFGGDTWDPAIYMDSQQLHADMESAGKCILARLAADRAERDERARPIDAEWLKFIGCKKRAVNRWEIQEHLRVNVWLYANSEWRVKIDEWMVQMHTRGQLLDFIRVLKGGV